MPTTAKTKRLAWWRRILDWLKTVFKKEEEQALRILEDIKSQDGSRRMLSLDRDTLGAVATFWISHKNIQGRFVILVDNLAMGNLDFYAPMATHQFSFIWMSDFGGKHRVFWARRFQGDFQGEQLGVDTYAIHLGRMLGMYVLNTPILPNTNWRDRVLKIDWGCELVEYATRALTVKKAFPHKVHLKAVQFNVPKEGEAL